MFKYLQGLAYLPITLILLCCTKGKGAVCIDGSHSSSTGRGTCSWHGGVDHYIDPNEISYFKTFFLVLIILFIIWRLILNAHNKT
jgi:hypothetical protein